MENTGEYKTETFPPSRIATIDIGQIGLQKHHIKALIELDVTEPRKLIREKRKQAEKISFNSWLIKCISLAVENCPQVHAVRKGKQKLILFEDIDISVVIEREVDGQKVPLPYVIRKTNTKSIAEIYDEVRSGQKQPIEGEDEEPFQFLCSPLVFKNYLRIASFLL